jgi:putative transposase
MATERYKTSAGACFSLKYHIVWCPKYRRPVLTPSVARSLKKLLREKAEELGMTIHVMEVMPEHVHLFIESDPVRCVAEIVNRLKGYTSHVLRDQYPWLRSRLPCLWSRSYYAATVGAVSEKAVKRYIEDQKGK